MEKRQQSRPYLWRGALRSMNHASFTIDASLAGKNSAAKLTIAHVMGYYMPGLGYQENYLPFAQAALGHEVHIITGDRYAPHERYEVVYAPRLGPRLVGQALVVDRGVSIHRLPIRLELERHQNPLFAGVAPLLSRLQPDIVHLHGVTPLSSLSVMLSSAGRRSTVVCDHHLCRFNLQPFTASKRLYYAAFRRLLSPLLQRRVKAWLPINEDAAQVLSDVLGIRQQSMIINRLGVDTTTFFRDPAAGRALRQAMDVPDDWTVFVHAGRIEARKNIVLLLDAFAAALSSRPACLLLAGDGPAHHMGELCSRVEALGLGNQVRFIGMQPHDKLPALFNAADIGVWPGDAAITMTEAMGCGLPLIVGSPPGRLFVGDCPDVEEFPIGQLKPLAALLERMTRRNEARRGRIARFAAERLSWPAIARDSLDIYRQARATTAG